MIRAQAWALLREYTQGESLIRHALAVEAAMRAYARRFGADEELWGAVGLLHDFDYEKWPDPKDHPTRGAEILRARGAPEELVTAILSHAEYLGIPRTTPLMKTLFAVDELCGFLTAAALIRPGKSILDLEGASVKKRMKDKAFARNVKREDIVQGTEELGVPLEEHIQFVIEAMRGIADELGLRGNTGAAGESPRGAGAG
ncbi:MAG: HDIG domain-containing protein [candidate division NC10 bacterium]|nr:HDIG domain-containing protein [candidate division NC10 bacterium]